MSRAGEGGEGRRYAPGGPEAQPRERDLRSATRGSLWTGQLAAVSPTRSRSQTWLGCVHESGLSAGGRGWRGDGRWLGCPSLPVGIQTQQRTSLFISIVSRTKDNHSHLDLYKFFLPTGPAENTNCRIGRQFLPSPGAHHLLLTLLSPPCGKG